MRVIAGTVRSLPLAVPRGREIRPTIDRYKETVFNIISPYIPNATVLDLFSGTGSIGIEALSRGAKEAYFVERARDAIECIEKNLTFTKFIDNAILLKYDYIKALMMLRDRQLTFDFIYIDPPYDKELEEEAIGLIEAYDLLDDNGIIVCESSVKTDMSFIEDSNTFNRRKTKVFKTCKFTFIEKL